MINLMQMLQFMQGGGNPMGMLQQMMGNDPRANYQYCVIVAQSIPTTATVGAPVVFTIGTGTQQYPLTKCNCAQATVCNIRSRTKYAVRLNTTATGGTFRMLGRGCCAPDNSLRSINGTAPATTSGVTE